MELITDKKIKKNQEYKMQAWLRLIFEFIFYVSTE